MSPMEFAEAVLAPGLSWGQVQALIRADVDADLAAIRARRDAEDSQDAHVLALPAPTEPSEEAA